MIKFNPDEPFLVTGASSGLGKAISIKIVENGGKVIGIARNSERLEETKQSCSIPENFKYESYDLSENLDNLPNLVTSIAEKYSRLRGIVLSAGIQETLPIGALKIANAQKLFDINYFANIALIKGFCKKKNNMGGGSSIVVLSSFTSLLGLPGTVTYSASKAALNSAVRTLAMELAKDKVRINAVLPGHILTELLTREGNLAKESFIETLNQKYPLGIGTPDDVSNIVCFLLSDLSKWITGQSIVVDGGASLKF